MNCTERETKVKQREKEREREREREIKEDKTEIGVSRQFAGQKKKKSARDQYPANMRNRMVSPKKAHTLRKREREREREKMRPIKKSQSRGFPTPVTPLFADIQLQAPFPNAIWKVSQQTNGAKRINMTETEKNKK